MPSLPASIMEIACQSPEGAPLCPNAFLHLGSRPAVDQALSRLARSGRLNRICQGIYVYPIQTRFGPRPPATEKVIAFLGDLWGETIVPSGGAAANAFGLTTQVPVQAVYLTSGPNRNLKLGESKVELRHAPRWQLVAPHRAAGDAIRALAWHGPHEVQETLLVLEQRLSREDFEEMAVFRAVMPAWVAEPLSAKVTRK